MLKGALNLMLTKYWETTNEVAGESISSYHTALQDIHLYFTNIPMHCFYFYQRNNVNVELHDYDYSKNDLALV